MTNANITIGQYIIKPYTARSGFTNVVKALVEVDGQVLARFNTVAAAKSWVTKAIKAA
jgi:hypothetical protein